MRDSREARGLTGMRARKRLVSERKSEREREREGWEGEEARKFIGAKREFDDGAVQMALT